MRAASVSLVAASLALAPACGGGGSSATDAHFVFEQNCAACHSLSAGKPSPNADAANLVTHLMGLPQVPGSFMQDLLR